MSEEAQERRRGGAAEGPLRPSQSILHAEIQQAVHELRRPTTGLIMSGLIAGFGIGTSVLAMAVLKTSGHDMLDDPLFQFLLANAYALGFVLVILGNTDLFTEYTTIALLPVLTRRSPIRQLGRLWGVIYLTNLAGGYLFALLLVTLGPALDVIDREVFAHTAMGLLEHSWWVLLLSSTLAGWLMGLLSWLVSSTKETVSQIIFVWIIGAIIGLVGLHHAVVGGIEAFAGMLVSDELTAINSGRFLFWVSAGNILGGFIFAALIRYSVLIRGETGKGRSRP